MLSLTGVQFREGKCGCARLAEDISPRTVELDWDGGWMGSDCRKMLLTILGECMILSLYC